MVPFMNKGLSRLQSGMHSPWPDVSAYIVTAMLDRASCQVVST